jgi:hypothetical protein
MVDAVDSKSTRGNLVLVRVRLAAIKRTNSAVFDSHKGQKRFFYLENQVFLVVQFQVLKYQI